MRRPTRFRKSFLLTGAALSATGLASPLQAQSNDRLRGGEWINSDSAQIPLDWERGRPPTIDEIVEIDDNVTLSESSGEADLIFLNARVSIGEDQSLTVARWLRIGTLLEKGGDIDISGGGALLVGVRGATDVTHLEIGQFGQGKIVVTDGLLNVTGGIQVAGGILRNTAASDQIFERLLAEPGYVPPLADGTLEVRGPDAKVVSNTLSVGLETAGSPGMVPNILGGNGVLNIAEQGLVETTSQARVNRNGIVTVSSGGMWDISSGLRLEGQLRIESGEVTITGNAASGGISPGQFEVIARIVGGSSDPTPTILGTLAIDGGSSRLTVNGTATVQRGDTRTEQVVVTRGGTLQATNIDLGTQTVVRLSDNARMIADDAIRYSGFPEYSLLTIESGSRALAGRVLIGASGGQEAESDGATILVKGAGSNLSASGSLQISGARGVVRINDGGLAQAPIVWIGRATQLEDLTISPRPGVGEIIVDGAGSRLIASERLAIGLGDGTLRAANGGTVEAQVIDLGLEGPTSSQLLPRRGTLIIGAAPGGIPADPGGLDIATDINIGSTGTILLNHDASAYSFDATVESDAYNTGLIEQRRGFSSLDGDMDRFTGNVLVSGGSLDVNVEIGSPLVTVRGGARLGGRGNVAGTVAIERGGVLAGGQGDGPLEMQTLELAEGAMVNVGLIGATTPAPVFHVRGDVTLDGTLNVDAPLDLGRGLYRIIDYGGDLTDRGMDIGVVPSGLDPVNFSLFLGAAGQVNLNYLGAGPGPVDPPVDSGNRIGDGGGTIVIGGEGWLDGDMPALLGVGDYAILAGPLTSLTVDDSGGDVALAGIQFAVDGVSLDGDALAGSDEVLTLRVGDGMEAGAGFTATIAAPIVGEAGVEKTDFGTLILTGANSYAGGTTIRGGTLRASGDGALGAADGSVTLDGGTLAASGAFSSARSFTIGAGGGGFDIGAGDWVLTGALGGSGVLTKSGTGMLALSGDSSGFAGDLSVTAGRLDLSGSIGGHILIGESATLSGTGTLGALTVAGTVAPGNSPGTLHVAGGILFRAGSTYQVEIQTDGAGDRIEVGGVATIEGGTVAVTALDPETDYSDGAIYRILDAAGGVTGTFDGVAENSAFLDFALGYDATGATIAVDVVRTFPAVAVTPNQQAVAAALMQLDRSADSDGLQVYNAILMLDEDAARGAFDAASGEVYPALLRSEAVAGLALPRRFLTRARSEREEGFGIWGGLSGLDQRLGSRARRTALDGIGGDFGIDYIGRGNLWSIGLGGGWQGGSADLSARSSRGDVDRWYVGGFARYGTGGGGLSLAASAMHAEADFDLSRDIAFGAAARTASASGRMRTNAAVIEARWGFATGDWALGPAVGYTYGRTKAGAFTETGADALDLSSSGARYRGGLATIGGFARYGGARGTVDLGVGYGRQRRADAAVTLAMRGSPQPFTVRADSTGRDAFVADLGATLDLGQGWSVGGDAHVMSAAAARQFGGAVHISYRF